MKKRLLLLPFALLGCLTAFAQSSPDIEGVLNNARTAFDKNMVQDSLVIKNADGTNIYKVATEFDANGNYTLYGEFYWDQGAWQNSTNLYHKYDDKNNSILDMRHSFNSKTNVWVGDGKTEWAFGENSDNYILRLVSIWDDVSNDWIYSTKDEIDYNTHGNKTLSVSFSWNNLSKTWKNDEKKLFEYNSDGDLISVVSYSWNSIKNALEKYDEENYSYDFTPDNEKRVEIISRGIPYKQEAFVDYKKRIEIYDASGNLISKEEYQLLVVGEEWRKKSKVEYKYNSNGKCTEYITFKRDPFSEGWLASAKQNIVFDENDRQILKTEYEWDNSVDDWRNSSELKMGYDANGNEILRVYYRWNTFENNWVGSSKSDWIYDDFGNQLLNAFSVWNYNLKKWSYHFRQEIVADAEGKPIRTIYYDCNSVFDSCVEYFKQEHEYNSDGYLSYDHGYNWKNNKWEKEGITTYYYSPRKGNSIENEAAEALQITPNPVVDGFVINGLSDAGDVQLKIVDMNGRVVKNQLVSNGGYVDCSALSSGVYVISLLDGSKVLTEKLVKR